MTVQEDGKEDASSTTTRTPKLASISTKGLLASLRERGDDVASTPDSTSPRSSGAGARFSTTPTTPVQVSPAVSNGELDLNPLRTNLNKFLTPSRTFSRLRDEKEEVSRLTPSPPSHGFRDGFTLPLVGEVKPSHLLQLAKTWLRNPKNLALLIWGLAVGVSGAILFMVMVGMLNHVLPDRTKRNTWFEVSNQIINALFTLMVLYLHPQRCLHLYMLWRWRGSDIVKLRNTYCKNGTRKPHEWGHMLVVVLLLQLNCIAQYALCGLNWGYRRAKRPAIGVAICLCLSMGGAAAAGIYNIVSSLGKEFEMDSDSDMEKGTEERDQHGGFTPHTKIYRLLERRVSFAYRDEGSLVEKPEWKGGVFDITNDPPVSILSSLCCVCVFGWNMDRLGFGNRFVHIITFVLICTAPFWIFDLAALNIQNRYVRHAIGGSGIALCAFGLFYGGYWRIRIRERFKLPGNGFCCGKPAITDCFQWLFFPLCSLCQEVRTAEFYDVKDDRFYSRSRLDQMSPPPGLASPHTPGPTLSIVREMSRETSGSLQEMSLSDLELRAHDSPYHSAMAMVPPTPPVIATGNPNLPSPNDSPRRSSSPSSHPFLNPSTSSPSNNPFLSSVFESPSESPSRYSTSTNPFLQPESHSRGSSPLRSPHHGFSSDNRFTPADATSSPPNQSPLRNSTSNNPFLQPESHSRGSSPLRSPHHGSSEFTAADSTTSGPSDILRQSPLRSPHRAGSSNNPFNPPETSSPAAAEEIPSRSLHRVGLSNNNPFSPPERSSPAADENQSFPRRTSSGPGNPFLLAEEVDSPGRHSPNPPAAGAIARKGSSDGLT